jgi:hypothetical protein
MALLSVNVLHSLGTAETTESQLGPGLPLGAEVGPVPVWKSPSSSVKHGLSCWSSVVFPCSSDASGADARAGSFGNPASVGVSPIQCRWNTFSLPGSSSESAYERASSASYHQSSSNLSSSACAFRMAQRPVWLSPTASAISARSA